MQQETGAYQSGPRWHKAGSNDVQRTPKRPQDRTTWQQKHSKRIQGSPLAHSGPKMAPSEPQGRPKWLQRETNIAKVVLALALDSAEEDQGGPKRATSIPTDATRAPEEAQRWPAKNIQKLMEN